MTLWLKCTSGTFGTWPIDCNFSPAPSVMGGGIGGRGHGQYYLENDGNPEMKQDTDKPPYRVPLMAEIEEIPHNGCNVVSTFSGAGGSCLGYRMAGFKVLWANEFVPAAQDTYRRNHPTSILDTRDIRTVQAQEVLDAVGLRRGELDLFDGSPPCQAFSTAGKREKGWGKGKTYEHGAVQKNEELFFEYIRLLEGLQPKVFVAENVSGLVKGTAKGYFKLILAALKECGYAVTAKLLDAQWLGVPQQRQRIIFVGVRNDLGLAPVHPKPLAYRYSVRDALPWIVSAMVRDGFTDTKPTKDMIDNPACSDTASGGSAYSSHYVKAESAVFVKVFHENGGFSRTECTDIPSPTITATQCRMIVEKETDISRHAITHFDMGKGFGEVEKVPADSSPYQTVGTSPSSGNGLATNVYCGNEKRKFTIAELKRICAFPDDFVLTGSYAQQWERLGNSVPPVMMYHIASAIRDGVLNKVPTLAA